MKNKKKATIKNKALISTNHINQSGAEADHKSLDTTHFLENKKESEFILICRIKVIPMKFVFLNCNHIKNNGL